MLRESLPAMPSASVASFLSPFHYVETRLMRPLLQFVALFVVSTVACQVCAADKPMYLLAPSYDYVSVGVFQDGLLKVATDDNHSGYINADGELVIHIAQNFDTLGNFHKNVKMPFRVLKMQASCLTRRSLR